MSDQHHQQQEEKQQWWFVSLRAGHELSEAEGEGLRNSLRRDIPPAVITGRDAGNGDGGDERETAEYLNFIDGVVLEISRGKPPCNKCREMIDELNLSFETAEAIDQCVKDFLTGLGATDKSRMEYIQVRPTTRLQDHLSDMNIDRGVAYDIEDCDEVEICEMEDLLEALSWDGFTALFDLYFHASNKILWVSPNAFVFMGIANDVFGRYSLELSVQDDYRIYGHSDDMKTAAELADGLVRLVSDDKDKGNDTISLGGMKNISRLSLNAGLLEELWGPVNDPSRDLAVCGVSLTPEQTLALLKPNDNRTKHLIVDGCHFQDDGRTFFDCIRSSQTPSSLELLRNPFLRYQGLFQFVSQLSVNTSLQKLKFVDWGLTPVEISALLTGVGANKNLKTLCLETERNWCPDQHWPLFCNMVRVHPCLQDVSQWCFSGDMPATGGRSLPAWTNMVADAAACNKTLTRLKLLSNQHDETVYQARIAPILAVNKYRPRMRAIAGKECDDGTSRRRQALFGRALATMVHESYARDLVFFALKANIDVIVTRWENPCKRPVFDQLAGGERNKRRKTEGKVHEAKETS